MASEHWNSPRAWSAYAILGVLVAGLIAVSFRHISRPFGNGDEIVYAQGIREMLASGDYLTLHWLGQPVLERPTTAFLVPALLSSVIDDEVGLRLFPVLCSVVIVLMSYRLGRGVGMTRDTAVVGAMLLTGISSFHLLSRSLLTDPVYALAVLAAVMATVRARSDSRYLVAAAAGLGAAVAIKSLAAAVPIAALAPFLWRPVLRSSRRQRLLAVGAFAILALPYYLMSLALHGDDFVQQHIVRTLFDRARGDLSMGMPGGFAAYLIYMWQADGPAIALLLPVACLGAVILGARERRPELVVIGGFPLMGLLLLSLLGTRLPHYLLILYAPAAVAMAALLDRVRARLSSSLLSRVVPLAVALALLFEGMSTTPDEHLMPSEPAFRLGLVAAQVARPGEDTIYTLEWYAPAVSYYGERDWVLLTRNRELFELLDSIDHIRAAGAATLAPPWPGDGKPILVAGPRRAVEALPADTQPLASTDEMVLVRARMRAESRAR